MSLPHRAEGLGLRVEGFGVWGFGLRALGPLGLGLWVQGFGLGALGLGLRLRVLGFRV